HGATARGVRRGRPGAAARRPVHPHVLQPVLPAEGGGCLAVDRRQGAHLDGGQLLPTHPWLRPAAVRGPLAGRRRSAVRGVGPEKRVTTIAVTGLSGYGGGA